MMMKKKKGFTLVELVVSMSILVIVLASCALIVVTISKLSAKKEYEEACLTEYQNASDLIFEYKNAFSVSEYSLYSVNTNGISLKKGDDEFTLTFNTTNTTLTAQIYNHSTNQIDTKNLKFNNLKNIQFVQEGNLVKCTYQFENFNQYTNLLNFGVNQ